MSNLNKTDDVIFNFFKQICDEKDDSKVLNLDKIGLQPWKTIWII